ncbi:MAG: hypothetical protein VXZ72_02880 [Chlamydiota bacterium]|nr:hypothetical protein [Chlamydiota bacterium]
MVVPPPKFFDFPICQKGFISQIENVKGGRSQGVLQALNSELHGKAVAGKWQWRQDLQEWHIAGEEGSNSWGEVASFDLSTYCLFSPHLRFAYGNWKGESVNTSWQFGASIVSHSDWVGGEVTR